MPKSLGQLHTVSETFEGFPSPLVSGDRLLLDSSRALCGQLQHMIRWGQIYKCVGIDLQATEKGGTGGGVSVSGEIRYYAPTKGRIQAIRKAYSAVREAMKIRGINVKGNLQYDFRIPLAAEDLYAKIEPAANVSPSVYPNAATLNGTDALALYHGTGLLSVFDVHNENIDAIQTGVPTFSEGFSSAGLSLTDFVLNEANMWSGSKDPFATTTLESIPFQIIWEPGSADNFATGTFQWRPDPALYLAVLTGQLEIYIDELELHDGADNWQLDVTAIWAGWKNILATPRRHSKRGKKLHGKKRRHSKR